MEVDSNPYQAAQLPAIERPAPIWPSIVVTGLLLMLTIATAAAFSWAAWYRFENTEAMGRMLVPPTIPLHVIDGFLVATGCVAAILGACTIGTFLWLLHYLNDAR